MPVNSLLENKRGVEKSKLSLSLNRNNANKLSNENKPASLKNICIRPETSGNKENNPAKRPFGGTYHNTLQAAKKLKPLTDVAKIQESRLVVQVPLGNSAMLNGHHPSDNQYSGSTQWKAPIATLSNLGNTCFLNSVLYTLRYAPQFVHNLHHLVSDLSRVEQKLGSIRLKSSSLGRSAAGLASSGTRSWSSKDLLSLGQADSSATKSKIQIATEKLHETYLSLRAAESKCLHCGATDAIPEPYAADSFLAALREVNSTFEGNRQQDAHELLVCILDSIRETCRALGARASRLQLQENGDSNGIGRQPNLDVDGGKTLGNLRKSWKKRKEVKTNEKRNSPSEERPPSPDPEKEERSRPGWDFVADDFEGMMVVRTMCLECEAVTEKAQAVCELCVPVGEDDTAEEPFRSACLSSEYLRDQNKYWCERCLRYNEARRSVAYSRLPRLLVLQLKRFSGGMEKITRHAPTPLLMPCFCEPCAKRAPDHEPAHRYILWAVIMHLGQTLTGGHYVAYARDSSQADTKCEREGGGDASTANSGSSFMRSLFNRPRPSPAGCTANECCVPRTRPEACWLACDDDLVKPISNEEFEDLLSAEPKMRSAATPYLLFYVKSEIG
ncbi:ubiquitin carboxyl-terminal hydrolase creB [Pararge aegeria]|uniref:Jg16263 protein n=3 Tax=Pararge aegeria TaxID=116150 RepID=A0A8S4RWG8_9NEOP|nr:ubiquitin carboxyl-terminal hydrolase creB [Pararge aegeria]XP_039749820.1 ubiquitin carboxyl-terminal hydrolase creB [Pararge aegeria]XP_039749821.1 ubiquitin carboxyl-terminal hydrolase creB [Pararge aegeria]CAH2241875.1 jg16263 [Pararge aegeria aegeria]